MSLHRTMLGGLLAAAFALAGCGSVQAPGAMPQTPNAQARPASSASGALLYVAIGNRANVKILTYPGLALVRRLKSPDLFGYASSNPNNGDVLLNHVLVYEYQHGTGKPMATIDPPYRHAAFDTGYDPTNNDIAITWYQNGDELAVYKTPSGTPKTYTDSEMPNMRFLCYDGQGNLFVDGTNESNEYILAELPKGGSQLKNLSVPPQLSEMRGIQWDRTYLAIQGADSIYQVSVSGSRAKVVGQTIIKDAWWRGNGEFWIHGDTVIGPHLTPGSHHHNGMELGLWHYPTGGKAYKVSAPLANFDHDRIYGETVSVAPHD